MPYKTELVSASRDTIYGALVVLIGALMIALIVVIVKSNSESKVDFDREAVLKNISVVEGHAREADSRSTNTQSMMMQLNSAHVRSLLELEQRVKALEIKVTQLQHVEKSK